MKVILAIGTGSFIGGISRYLMSQFVQSRVPSDFPYGTMAVNILGCFLIGMVFAIGDNSSLSEEWKLFLTTGLLGGFTTFSAFSNETVQLLRDSQYITAGMYTAGSLGIGLIATFLGIVVVKAFV
jgi:CrcB protein